MIYYKVTRIDQTKDPITYFVLFSDFDPTTFKSAKGYKQEYVFNYKEIFTPATSYDKI